MIRIVPLAQVSDSMRGGAISIGNFDGVHVGHAALFSEVRRLADEIRGPAITVVLDPHPAAILRPKNLPPKLTTLARRAELIGSHGIDFLVIVDTTPEFLRLSAETFFRSLVVEQLQAKGMVEGPNFYFGRGRGGNVDTLRELCNRHQIRLAVVEPENVEDGMISSTRIRQLLVAGRVDEAIQLLGCPYRIDGQVVSGAGRGRQIGFPTANLEQIEVVLPGVGVYGGFAYLGDRQYDAAVHIGPSPTFESDGATRVEIHVLDYDGDLYDRRLTVDFVTRVRDIARFDSARRLAEQLAHDVETIRSRLASFRRRERTTDCNRNSI